MKDIYELHTLIEKYSDKHQGIFSISDLKNLLNESNRVVLYRMIRKLEEKSILKKFCRGFYITRHVNLDMLSARINIDSYISFGTVLARELVIGSVSAKKLTCVKLGRKREYIHDQGTLLYLSISPHLFFGYTNKEGINYADKEKAALDTLYFYQKGHQFSFNIFTDIHFDLLDKNKLKTYLQKYKNPKFIHFVKGFINEKI